MAPYCVVAGVLDAIASELSLTLASSLDLGKFMLQHPQPSVTQDGVTFDKLIS